VNELEQLCEFIRQELPAAVITVDKPTSAQGNWFVDILLDKHEVTVEWSIRRGFGISASPVLPGLGEGPEETYSDPYDATARVFHLLKNKAFTNPPTAVALQDCTLAILIRWSIEDQLWIAEHPELEDLKAQGKSPEQALSELKTALRAYMQVYGKLPHPLHYGTAQIQLVPKT
jgi:predicted RNase H-like HicB family nuclease